MTCGARWRSSSRSGWLSVAIATFTFTLFEHFARARATLSLT